MSLYLYLAAVRNDDDGNYYRVPLNPIVVKRPPPSPKITDCIGRPREIRDVYDIDFVDDEMMNKSGIACHIKYHIKATPL